VHRKSIVAGVIAALLAVPAPALAGHGLKLDHASRPFTQQAPPSPNFTSGGPGAKWEPIRSFPTGNPHTDIDFFIRGGETFASVGTLAIGPNAGGQVVLGTEVVVE